MRRERFAVLVAVILSVSSGGTARAQVQRTGFTPSVTVTSTSAVAVDSIQVGAAGAVDVALFAHLSIEGMGFGYERYAIGLCRGSATGPLVGQTLWRPGETAGSGFEAHEVSVTGFDAAVTGPVTYVICARKIDFNAPDITIYQRGLNALRAPAGTTLRGSQTPSVLDGVAVTSTTAVAVDSIAVEGTGPTDVALFAHLSIEGAEFDYKRYDIGLCRGTAAGPMIGRTFWRPGETAGAGFEAHEVSVTGFDAAVVGAVEYVVCARKIDFNAPDVTVYQRGLNAFRAPSGTTIRGNQTLDFSAPVSVTSTTAVAVDSVAVDGDGTTGVALFAHLSIEGMGFGYERYAIGLCRDSATGPLVGQTLWRPGETTGSGFEAHEVSVTGFDAAVTGPVTYVICARKIDFNGPDITVYQRGINAIQVPEPGRAEVVVAALLGLAILGRARSR